MAEYPRHLFKSPGGYGEGKRSYKLVAAADEEEEAELLEQGWHLTKEEAWGANAPKASPLDRDGKDGPGGSLPRNVPTLRGIAKAEKINLGDARSADDIQAIILKARLERNGD